MKAKKQYNNLVNYLNSNLLFSKITNQKNNKQPARFLYSIEYNINRQDSLNTSSTYVSSLNSKSFIGISGIKNSNSIYTNIPDSTGKISSNKIRISNMTSAVHLNSNNLTKYNNNYFKKSNILMKSFSTMIFSNSNSNKSTNNDNNEKNNKNKKGKMQLILGPMFAGKTTELIRELGKYNITKTKVLAITAVKDTRYTIEDKIITHDKIEYPAIRCEKIRDVLNICDDYEVIGIDEGHFFSDIVEAAEELADKGKKVYISGLLGNYKREYFDVIARLIPKSDNVINLKARCFSCDDDANFTARITTDTQEILVGGEDIYKACCRRCYNKYVHDINKVY